MSSKLRLSLGLIAATFLLVGIEYRDSLEPGDRGQNALAARSTRPPLPRARNDHPEEAQAFYLRKRSPDGRSPIPVEKYLVAKDAIKRMPLYSSARGQLLPAGSQLTADEAAAWTYLGPGNIGGRTRALLVAKSNPNLMYAAGVAGGVWKSTNGGRKWTPLGDFLANLAVCSMVMDPSNPQVIYAGTGEGYFNGDGVRGAGIFKTTNGGTSWSHLSTTRTADFYYVNDIVISPVDSQNVYAGTSTGVWRSMDGGATWSRVLNPNVRGGCLDLAIRGDTSTDTVFASCGTVAQATIYRNTDAAGAGSWASVLTESGMGRTSLAIAPSDPSVIYALASSIASGDYQYGLHAVFRSTSDGDPGSWTARVRNTDSKKLNTVLLSNPVFAFYMECGYGSQNYFYNQGWYDNVIAVDPKNSNRVWAGGIDLFRSDDGGANWGLASYWWADPDRRFAHADQHVIVFHPAYNGTSNRVMFVGNDGGIFKTVNALAAPATGPSAPCGAAGSMAWTDLNNDYGVTQFYHGLPYPGGTRYFGGTQDNGTIRGASSSGPNRWATIQGGDGGYVAVDPTDPDTIFAEYYGISLQKSTNGGASWNDATSGITESSSGFLFIVPYTMDPNDPDVLWIGGRYIWRTKNGASSWSRAGAQLSGGPDSSLSAIAVAPSDSNYVLAGTSEGYIHRSSQALSTQTNTKWAAKRPRTGYVSWCAFDPFDRNRAYATYSTFGGKHVWTTTNGGASWQSIDGSGGTGIPDIPVHSIVVDPSNSSRLYVGTDLGVFVSQNGGSSWAVENTGFANVVTEALAVGEFGGAPAIFAFTHGRGAFRLNP